MSRLRVAAPLLLLACLVRPLAAQEGDTSVSVADLKTKTDLTDDDKTRIRTFVTQRVSKVTSSPLEARQATEELRSSYDGTDAFKREYASACVELIGSAFKKAELIPATRLLAVLNSFSTAQVHSVLLDALQDERVGLRAAGAVGLRALREKLAAAGPDVYQKVLAGLKDAGKREKSREALKAIYGAINYAELPSPPDAKANIAAVLELLEARAAQYKPTGAPALGADDVGLRVAQRLLKSMEEPDRKRLTVLVATLVKHGIELYALGDARLSDVRDKDAARESAEARNGVERLIMIGEELLVSLVKPDKAPSVTDSMKKLDPTAMRNQWKEWVAALQKATGQDFSIAERPEAEGQTTPDAPGAGG